MSVATKLPKDDPKSIEAKAIENAKATIKIKGESPDGGHIVIAINLMKEILYDAGAVMRGMPERYPLKWVQKILVPAGMFFDKYPELLTDENISLLCCGEETEMLNTFAGLDGFPDLHQVLNDYFNQI